MNKELNYGVYNKYIFNNNSYLSLHIVRETYRNNKKNKNINKLIDFALQKEKINQNVKNSIRNIKLKASIKRINFFKRNNKSTNTCIETFDKATNTSPLEINIEDVNYLTKIMKKNIIISKEFNSNNATLSNRLNLLKKE